MTKLDTLKALQAKAEASAFGGAKVRRNTAAEAYRKAVKAHERETTCGINTGETLDNLIRKDIALSSALAALNESEATK